MTIDFMTPRLIDLRVDASRASSLSLLIMACNVKFQSAQGELVGNGSLIIGPTAEVISNLRGLHEVSCSDSVQFVKGTTLPFDCH